MVQTSLDMNVLYAVSMANKTNMSRLKKGKLYSSRT